jgi:two-component system, NtrC family, sensor kinase
MGRGTFAEGGPLYQSSSLPGAAGLRENEAFAAVFRATVGSADPAEAVQRATEALHPLFPTSLIVVWLRQGEQILLTGLQLPEGAPARLADDLRAAYGSVSLDADLPAPLAMRTREKFRLRENDARDPMVASFMRELGATEALVMPLMVDDQAVGCTIVTSRETEGVGTEDEQILDSVLRHLVLVYQSMRVRERDTELLRELRVLARAVQQMPHPLKVFTPDWKVRYVNAAFEKVLGYTSDEVHGWHASVFRETQGPFPSQQEIEEATLREGVWEGEVLDRHRSGRSVPMRATVVPVYDSEGWITDIVELEQDLTRERVQAKAAAEAYRLAGVGQLAASVAHEVNNPLASISGLAELLLDQDLDAESRDDLVLIREEAKRAGAIVQNLLAFSRRDEPKQEGVDLPEMVQAVLDLQRQTLVSANVRVDTDFSPGLRWVRGDSHQLQQVLHNLLRNAAQAIGEVASGGVITIRARNQNGSVEMILEDTGPGIPSELQQRIFEPFFTTKEIGRGTGLGLSVTADIIRGHGGELLVENWGEPVAEAGALGAGGARFILRLPATRSPERRPTPPQTAALRDETGGKTCEVLVIEDEPGVVRMLEKVLGRLGYRSVLCTSAEEGLRAVTSGRHFDAVVVDLQMPGIGGAGFYRKLQEIRPELLDRLIFASGDISSGVTHEFLRMTGRPVLAKPFPLTELTAAIREVAERC